MAHQRAMAGATSSSSRCAPLQLARSGMSRRPFGQTAAHAPCNLSGRGSRRCLVRSSAGESEAEATSMTKREAYNLLGVSEGAGFDEILSVKKKLIAASSGDKERELQIEMAYDILLMQSMKKRLSGQSGVNVRYADVRKPRTQATSSFVDRLPVKLQRPPQQALITQSAVFGALAAWALLQGLTEPPGLQPSAVPSLQIALALGASVYFLRDGKSLPLPRALGIAVAGFIAGALLGTGFQNWLRVDIVPIGGLSSPGVLVSEFAILGAWLSCIFFA